MRLINFEKVYQKVQFKFINYGGVLTELLLEKVKEILTEKYAYFKAS